MLRNIIGIIKTHIHDTHIEFEVSGHFGGVWPTVCCTIVAAVDAWKEATPLKPDLKPKLPSVASCRHTIGISSYRCTIVQLYNSSKTQNGHNFGHEHATDL